MIQEIITLVIVGFCAVYTLYQLVKLFLNNSKSKCSGCTAAMKGGCALKPQTKWPI